MSENIQPHKDNAWQRENQQEKRENQAKSKENKMNIVWIRYN